jgi:hypothetical protein
MENADLLIALCQACGWKFTKTATKECDAALDRIELELGGTLYHYAEEKGWLAPEPIIPEKRKPHVVYSTDGNGNWMRREWKRQCCEGVFLNGACQGVEGHKGVHWSYKEDGSFSYSDNDNDSTEKGCSGSIPPDHETYRTPSQMAAEYYTTQFVDSVVTDPAHIARLEEGDEEGASFVRPCSVEVVEELRAAGRLDDI